MWLPAGVLWYYCKSNLPLKWQFTKSLMKCIANMLVSGWLGKLTAAYFLYCHICLRAEKMRSSFLGKLFLWSIQTASHLLRTGNQSLRGIPWGLFFFFLICFTVTSSKSLDLQNVLLVSNFLTLPIQFSSLWHFLFSFLAYQFDSQPPLHPLLCFPAWTGAMECNEASLDLRLYLEEIPY